MIMLVVTDDGALRPEHEGPLRRLQVQHEILWLTIADAVLTDTPASTRGVTPWARNRPRRTSTRRHSP